MKLTAFYHKGIIIFRPEEGNWYIELKEGTFTVVAGLNIPIGETTIAEIAFAMADNIKLVEDSVGMKI